VVSGLPKQQQQQQQTKTMKHNTIPKLGASLLVALGLTAAANAAFINGGISFAGDYTVQNSSSVDVTLLSLGSQIAFVNPGVTTSRGGNFTIIPAGSPVTMATPLIFVPPTVPGGNLWSVTDGTDTFTFLLNSMTVDPIETGPPEAVRIHGTGDVSYTGPNGPFQTTPGSWVANFSSGGGSFAWSSTTVSTPDGGTTMALFGVSLLGLGAIRRKLLKL
jgi:hypothetical protein